VVGRTACINGKTEREREKKQKILVYYRVLSSVDGLLPF